MEKMSPYEPERAGQLQVRRIHKHLERRQPGQQHVVLRNGHDELARGRCVRCAVDRHRPHAATAATKDGEERRLASARRAHERSQIARREGRVHVGEDGAGGASHLDRLANTRGLELDAGIVDGGHAAAIDVVGEQPVVLVHPSWERDGGSLL